MADAQTTDTPASTKSVDKQLEDIRDQIAEMSRPDKDAPREEHREYKKAMNGFSVKAAALRKKQIAEDDSLDDKEKAILALYDKGVQVFAIAKQVYDFANSDTVGQCMLVIRKAHADDFNEIEDVASTKGYSGIGVSA